MNPDQFATHSTALTLGFVWILQLSLYLLILLGVARLLTGAASLLFPTKTPKP